MSGTAGPTKQKLAQGIEPWTSTLPRWRSTAELCQQQKPTCGSCRHPRLQQTVGEARHLRRCAFDPRHLLALAKAVGAAEALKGEKYKPALFIVKWGKDSTRFASLAFRTSPDS